MDNKQKEQLKKGLVFSGLGLLCALSIWFIFAPSDKDKAKEQQGLNKDIPQATVEQLTDNKLKAYELGDKSASEEQAQAEMGRLSDYFADATPTPEVQQAQQASSAKIEGSLQRYEENNRLLSSFYAPDPHEEEREALRAEIDDLREELRKKDSEAEDEEEKQLRLMERSYQMASKYLPKGTNLPANAFAEATERPIAEPQSKSNATAAGEPMLEALTEQKSIVSSLTQPMSNSAFIQEYGARERHLGFHSLASQKNAVQRNTLRVVVYRTTTLQEGEYVALRLLETARIKDLRIPLGSKLIAQVKIEDNRMQLLIKSIEVGGQITPVKLSAYDTDGQEGIYIPGSENVSALKEMGANIGGSMGTSFTFASSAKDQIISEAARGAMQRASQLLQKKLRTVKVTLERRVSPILSTNQVTTKLLIIKTNKTMKRMFLSALMLVAGITTTFAQNNERYRPLNSGNLYQGMTKAIPSGRILLPYGLEVTFDKTSHLIFPAPIRYVDLGNNNLIAGKA